MAAEQAASPPVPVRIPIDQGVVLLELDIAVHVLQGVASQLVNLGKQEAAQEVVKSFEHLLRYKERYLRSLQSKILIASPSDLPKTA